MIFAPFRYMKGKNTIFLYGCGWTATPKVFCKYVLLVA